MIAVAAAPLLVGLLLGRYAGALARRVRPGIAAALITGLALTSALCTGLVLSAAAVLACAQLDPLPRIGQWSAAALRTDSGLPLPLGLVALLYVAACLLHAITRIGCSLRDLQLGRRAAKGMPTVAGDLVLLDDQAPVAYSLAGSGGRIVISTGMFSALSAPERRVLLAHEAAHLRHHHHAYLHLARLAAAANPLLRRTVASVELAVERWADEDAAAEVGDRRLAARALAHAALARAGRAADSYALGVADSCVVERVRLLLAPALPRRRGPIVVGAAVASWAAAAAFTFWANVVVQLAESVYLRH